MHELRKDKSGTIIDYESGSGMKSSITVISNGMSDLSIDDKTMTDIVRAELSLSERWEEERVWLAGWLKQIYSTFCRRPAKSSLYRNAEIRICEGERVLRSSIMAPAMTHLSLVYYDCLLVVFSVATAWGQ